MIPHAAPRSTTSYEVICVGTAFCDMATGMSYASSTSAAAWARTRTEAPVVGDDDALLRGARAYPLGDALGQRRTFSYV